jgi:hypothetical protein
MLALRQSVLNDAEPIPAIVGFLSVRCCLVRQRATGSALKYHGITIAASRSGAQEADHHQ